VSEEATEPKKRKSRPKYTQFTLEHLRANGKVPAIVERLIPSRPFMQRKDMFGLLISNILIRRRARPATSRAPVTLAALSTRRKCWRQRTSHPIYCG